MDLENLEEEELKELIKKVRIYLNDKAGDIFTDDEIIELLKSNCCLYKAVGDGWTIRSMQVDIDRDKGYTVGVERYERAAAGDIVKIAMQNANYFNNKCKCDEETNKYDGISFMIKSDTKVDY